MPPARPKRYAFRQTLIRPAADSATEFLAQGLKAGTLGKFEFAPAARPMVRANPARSVDQLDDFLLVRINQHHLIADREIPVPAELAMGAHEFLRHRLPHHAAW